MKLSVYIVGSNPLPVLIAMCYDLKIVDGVPEDHENPSQIIFVCSEDTKKYVERIKKLIEKITIQKHIPYPKNDTVIINDAHNAQHVYKVIKDRLEKSQSIDSVFLNNTGGTKVMSVNTTLAVIDYSNKSKEIHTLLEADVDPEKKLMNISDMNKNHDICDMWPGGNVSFDTQFGGIISLSDIIEVYDYKEVKFMDFSYTMQTKEKTLLFVKDLFIHYEAYRDFSKLFFACKEVVENKKIISSVQTPFDALDIKQGTLNDFFSCKKNLNKASQVLFKLYINNGSANCDAFMSFLKTYEIVDENHFTDKKKLKYLTGGWLEEYFHAVLNELTGENNQYEIRHSVKIKPASASGNTEFEIDIILRNGITTSFISCTTDNTRGLANHKVLEVMSNADSLGLRTQVTLVTLASETKDGTKMDLLDRYEMFDATHYKKLKIFYLEDVQDADILKDKLREMLS